MQATHRIFTILTLVVLVAALTTGCDEDQNARVAKVALEATRQQADQNREMARVNQTVAEARQELVKLNHVVQSERGGLNAQRDQLEAERKAIARQRRTESWVGPLLRSSGMLLVAGLAIGFCWSLIFGLRKSDAADAELNELLICELASERPSILPQPKRLSAPPIIEDGQADELPTTALPVADE